MVQEDSKTMKFIIENPTGRYEFNLEDIADSNSKHRHFAITLPKDIASGEYEYSLYDEENKIIAKGLLVIEDVEEKKDVYDNEVNYIYG